MILSTDMALYLVAASLFFLAGFNIQITYEGDKLTSIGWQWLAFMVLVISLIV